MGRRGYVQTRPPEYGSCITDWAQDSLYRYLTRKGLEVNTTDGDFCNTEDADHWEIPIPEKGVGRGKKRKYVYEYDKILEIAADLRKNPKAVTADGEGGVRRHRREPARGGHKGRQGVRARRHHDRLVVA